MDRRPGRDHPVLLHGFLFGTSPGDAGLSARLTGGIDHAAEIRCRRHHHNSCTGKSACTGKSGCTGCTRCTGKSGPCSGESGRPCTCGITRSNSCTGTCGITRSNYSACPGNTCPGNTCPGDPCSGSRPCRLDSEVTPYCLGRRKRIIRFAFRLPADRTPVPLPGLPS